MHDRHVKSPGRTCRRARPSLSTVRGMPKVTGHVEPVDVVKFTVRHSGKAFPSLSLAAPSPDPPCGAFRAAGKDAYGSGTQGDGTVWMRDCHCPDLLPARPSGLFGRLGFPGVVTLALREQVHCLNTRLAEFA